MTGGLWVFAQLFVNGSDERAGLERVEVFVEADMDRVEEHGADVVGIGLLRLAVGDELPDLRKPLAHLLDFLLDGPASACPIVAVIEKQSDVAFANADTQGRGS